jgi:hypothetical protein
MNILCVGYTPEWKGRVLATLPDNANVTIKGEFLATTFVQEERPFDLYIFGNRLEKEHDVSVELLKEASGVGDKTPTIVFSEEFDAVAEAKILGFGAALIRSDTPNADEVLQYMVCRQLGLA